ncbi:MAG: hypothetical protein OIF50_07510, partial [Flavobacteriaceae bacterium]|nr:hypothetical protein [Flavobacteriaceae bacterium]
KSASFPNKLEMARQLLEGVSTLPQFVETEAALVKELKKHIASGKTLKDNLDVLKDARKTVVKIRYKRYKVGEDSLMRRLTRLNKYLLGRREVSPEGKRFIQQIIQNMRQFKPTIKQVAPIVEGDTNYTKHNSTYGKLLADLQHIINVIATFGPTYKGVPELISIARLQALHNELQVLNKKVTIAKAEVKVAEEKRREIQELLVQTCMEIKYLIESNYTKNSAAYRTIKAL